MATAELDPTTTILSGIAAHEQGRFRRANLRIRRSKVVHAVRVFPWIARLGLPGPACDQGWGGPGIGGELHPVREPVTCRRCLASAQARATAQDAPATGGQLALDLRY